mmetsp:Transcript_23811/g.55199  ORF Transcript_23811/g.55199 Transcript_23811/m.55199 type:complete len:218 (-) Transcript_23811:918-1571(-)
MLMVRQDARRDAAAHGQLVLLLRRLLHSCMARSRRAAPDGAHLARPAQRQRQGRDGRAAWAGRPRDKRAKVARGGGQHVLHAVAGRRRAYAQAGVHAAHARWAQARPRQDAQNQLRHRAAAAALAAADATCAQQRGRLGGQARRGQDQRQPPRLHDTHVQRTCRDLRHFRRVPLLLAVGVAVELPAAQHLARARELPRRRDVFTGGAGGPLREFHRA